MQEFSTKPIAYYATLHIVYYYRSTANILDKL